MTLVHTKMFLESDRKQWSRVISCRAGMPPRAMRAQCSPNRYCPDPLGIVTLVYIRQSFYVLREGRFFIGLRIKNGQPEGRPTQLSYQIHARLVKRLLSVMCANLYFAQRHFVDFR